MNDQPKRRGRRSLTDVERKRHTLTFRLRDDLKSTIEKSAQASGRSLSEEVEHRVESSFDRNSLLADFLSELSQFIERGSRR